MVAKQKVDVDTLLSSFKATDEKLRNQRELSPYWIGLSRDCPLSGANVGAFDLCQKMVKRTGSVSGETTEEPYAGKVIWLTDKEVQYSLDVLKYAFVRKIIHPSEKHVYTYKNFHPNARVNKTRDLPKDENDIPLANYVYIQRLDPDDLVGQRPYGTATPPVLNNKED